MTGVEEIMVPTQILIWNILTSVTFSELRHFSIVRKKNRTVKITPPIE